MGGGVIVPPWMGLWGSMDRTSFDTETERGPQRATEKASIARRGAARTMPDLWCQRQNLGLLRPDFLGLPRVAAGETGQRQGNR
jgi:hypothetical protein